MNQRQLDALRPWTDDAGGLRIGWLVDAGYRPPKHVIEAGYIENVVDNFWRLTDKGAEEAIAYRDRKVPPA